MRELAYEERDADAVPALVVVEPAAAASAAAAAPARRSGAAVAGGLGGAGLAIVAGIPAVAVIGKR